MRWDPVAGGAPRLLGRSDDGLYAIAFRPDGGAVASGGADLALKLEEQGYTWLEQGGIKSLDVEIRA